MVEPAGVSLEPFCGRDTERRRSGEPAAEILRSEATKDLNSKLYSLFPIPYSLNLVEAAGVEPASEIVVSQETPCSVRSKVSLPALRTDKKRLKLVR